MFHALIMTLPDITHLCDRAKIRSLKFIKEMIEIIRAFNEFRCVSLDSKLYLAYHVFEEKIDHDVIVIII
jgi:hypothetical protein